MTAKKCLQAGAFPWKEISLPAKANRTKTKMAGNIDDACLDEYHFPRRDESFGIASAPGEWVGDYDYASELDVSDLVSSSALYYFI